MLVALKGSQIRPVKVLADLTFLGLDLIVEDQAVNALVRNKLLNIGSRVAPRVAVMNSAEAVKAMIDDEVVLALTELTADAPRSTNYAELRESVFERFRPTPK